MAFNTNIRPINYGGGELPRALSEALGIAISRYREDYNKEQERNFAREQMFYKVLNDIDPIEAVMDVNKKRMLGLKEEYEKFITDRAKKNRADFTHEDIVEAQVIKNKINSHIATTKKQEEQISKEMLEIQKNPKKYSQEHADAVLQKYIESNGEELQSLLKLNPKDPYEWARGFKSTTINQKRDGDYVIDIKDTDEKRTGRFMTGITTDPLLMEGMYTIFSGEWEGHPNTPTPEERETYLKMAKELQETGNSILGDVNLDAAVLWGQENIVKEINPNTRRLKPKTGKGGKSKQTAVQRQGNSWQFYDDPIKLDFYDKAKRTDLVELVYGQPDPNQPEGLYFKAYKTSEKAASMLDSAKKGSDNVTVADLYQLLHPSQYEEAYIPYNRVAGMNEVKGYRFEGLNQFINPNIQTQTRSYNFGNTR